MTRRLLRGLAALLVRGPDAPIVLGDLEEAMHRDLAGGTPAWRAHTRYLRNALGSAIALRRGQARRQRRRAPALGMSLLDVKLGLRMLVKHPGLTLVAVFALALGIPASLAPFHFFSVFEADLPFEGGERIVGLRYREVDGLDQRRGSAFEYQLWRDRLAGVEELGAARMDRYNVLVGGRASPLPGAEMTASGFRITGIPPLLGRPLLDADEEPGGPDVVVIGYDVWRSLFARDPEVVGRTMLVAGEPRTIVGVMPEGFLFPEHQQLWLPLRTGTPAEPTLEELLIFGRLAQGVTEQRVLAQMESIHRSLVERFPDLLGDRRPQVVHYLALVNGNPSTGDAIRIGGPLQLLALLLLAVACGNVGTLILARTATRTGELAVRTALGASRARIVGQLFAESLVLALVATGVGLGFAAYVTARFGAAIASWEDLPFWFDFGLSRGTVLLALGLSLFCAVAAGVGPALKATAGGIQGSLQRAAASRSGVRFGGLTSALIVAEIALGVACLFTGGMTFLLLPHADAPMEIPTERFLAADLRVPPVSGAPGSEEGAEAHRARVSTVHTELVERLSAEVGVRGVALTRRVPGAGHPSVRIEVEGGEGGGDGLGHRVLLGQVGVGFFEGVGAPVLEGRGFREDDLEVYAREGDAPVIVNTAFVDRVFRGENPIGQRIRYVVRGGNEPGRWYQVVGVVPPLGMSTISGVVDGGGLYQPIAPGALERVSILLRVDGDPTAWTPRLRATLAAIDPAALVERAMPLGEVVDGDRVAIRWVLLAIGVVAGISIVLSIAGLYALMSFTVAQRTREIGVRSALGADTGRIVAVIAKRAVLQLLAGAAVGVAGGLTFVSLAAPEFFTWVESEAAVLLWAAGIVLVVGLLACVVPVRRGLGLQPMEALRADG
jgi:predicted permease